MLELFEAVFGLTAVLSVLRPRHIDARRALPKRNRGDPKVAPEMERVMFS